MPKALGDVCIVLHGHLPYVLHHGVWPHGETWLHEAAAETYLPLIELLGEFVTLKVRPALVIGLTPVLVEQMRQRHFVEQFPLYLQQQEEMAHRDQKLMERGEHPLLTAQALRWRRFYRHRLQQFRGIDGDIPGAIGRLAKKLGVQILGGPAAHCYSPLLLHDASIRAQLAAGRHTLKHHLGVEPTGLWLPECGYRPAVDAWAPAALGLEVRPRVGVEDLLASAGYSHFFVDAPTLAQASVQGLVEAGRFMPVVEEQLHWDPRRGWRLPMDAVGVTATQHAPKCFALPRHPRLSEQVWSAESGYPGAGAYLDFHRRLTTHGLRYHRVTDISTPLDRKEPYDPAPVPGLVFEQATHFCRTVREALADHRLHTGRRGLCVLPFDAELFGHWWFEGPQFLRNVLLSLHHDRDVELVTAEAHLFANPPDKVMRLPEGSWGQGGGHAMWLNDATRWMWEVEYRAEARFLELVNDARLAGHAKAAAMLQRAGRELLLMQSSDWPFVVSSRGAVDYGHQRFSLHSIRFDRAVAAAEALLAGRALDERQQAQIAELDAHEIVFSAIDLDWWR